MLQEDGWVVCRVFKKKGTNRGFQPEVSHEENFTHMEASSSTLMEPKQNSRALLCNYTFDSSMHLPQLLSPESAPVHSCSFLPAPLTSTDVECSHNLLKLTSAGFTQQEKFSSDWSFLDKLLASNQCFDQGKSYPLSQVADLVHSAHRFPFQYLGTQPDFSNFSK